MPQRSELTVLLTLDLPNRGEGDRLLESILNFLSNDSFWGSGPLTWNMSGSELRDSDLAHELKERLSSGDFFAPAGYSKAPHTFLSTNELKVELNGDSAETGIRPVAYIPHSCDAVRTEADLQYRAADAPFVIGRCKLQKQELLVAYRSGILVGAPLLSLPPPPPGRTISPGRLRQVVRRLRRTTAHQGPYSVLHLLAQSRQDMEYIIAFMREASNSARFRTQTVLTGLRLSSNAEALGSTPIVPLFLPAGDPLLAGRVYRASAARSTGNERNVLNAWLSVDEQPARSRHRDSPSSSHSSPYQVVASMQGESSLSEGEVELRCTEGVLRELRVAGTLLCCGEQPVARAFHGGLSRVLEARGVVSIESDSARGLSARFALPEDELSVSRLSIRYLFFDGSEHLFIESELDLSGLSGMAETHSFESIALRAAGGVEIRARHPVRAQYAGLDPAARSRNALAGALTFVPKSGAAGLSIGALGPSLGEAGSVLLYQVNSALYIGPSYGPVRTELVDGLLDRRVLVLGVARPGTSGALQLPSHIRSRLYEPVCRLL